MNIPTGTALMVKLMEWERKTGNKFMTLLMAPNDVSLSDMVTLAEIVVGKKPKSPKEALEIYMEIIGQAAGAENVAYEALEDNEKNAMQMLNNPQGVPVNPQQELPFNDG